MPVAIEAPWDQIQAAMMSGKDAEETAELFKEYKVTPGAIRKRAQRGNWNVARIQMEKRVKSILPKSVQERGGKVREQLGLEIEKATESLAALEAPTSLNAIDRTQTVISKIVTNAEKVFGWNADQSSDVRITVLSGASESEDSHDQVIDV